MCHCGAVVKELLARAEKPGSTSGDADFCFLGSFFFFFCLVSFLKHYFSFWPTIVSLFLLPTLLVMHASGCLYLDVVQLEYTDRTKGKSTEKHYFVMERNKYWMISPCLIGASLTMILWVCSFCYEKKVLYV